MAADSLAKKKITKLKEAQVQKAVTALLKWTKSQKQKGKPQMLEEDDMFYVVVALNKTPDSSRTNGHRIPIPHSMYPLGEGREVCLIVNDSKQETYKGAKQKIIGDASSGVTKVIGVQKLRTKYKPFEAKRQLCGSYDLFLADDRVIALLPKLLGKTFFKKKKHPIPVSLKGGKWREKIRQACNSTYLYLSDGPCSVVRAARTSQSEEEIVENIMAVVAGLAEHVPRKWKNIQALYLKTQDSASLPIYTARPEVPLKISPQQGKTETAAAAAADAAKA